MTCRSSKVSPAHGERQTLVHNMAAALDVIAVTFVNVILLCLLVCNVVVVSLLI